MPFAPESVTRPQSCASFLTTRKNKGNAPVYDLHHRRWRLGRLGAGPSALRQKRQQGSALRSRPGHAARPGAGRNPRQLFRHRLFRSALPLDRAEGHHADRQPQQSGSAPSPRKYEQARVLGGGSSINGQLANRGAPTDYDEWEARGAAGWAWNDVLPYFRKVERDLDFDGPYPRQGRPHPGAPHSAGSTGPDMRPPWPRPAISPACRFCPTRTASSPTAIFRSRIPTRSEQRVSAAMGYLDQ